MLEGENDKLKELKSRAEKREIYTVKKTEREGQKKMNTTCNREGNEDR